MSSCLGKSRLSSSLLHLPVASQVLVVLMVLRLWWGWKPSPFVLGARRLEPAGHRCWHGKIGGEVQMVWERCFVD